MKSFFKRPVVIAFVVILVIGGFAIFKGLTGGSTSAQDTAVAALASVTQEVSATGKIQPTENVDLAFEKSGKVSKVSVDVGDRVSEGQVLAEQSSSDLQAQLAQARGSLASAQSQLEQYYAARDTQAAKLDSLKAGTRPESILVKESELAKAEADLSGDYQDALNTMLDSFIKAEDAVRNKTSGMFSGAPGIFYDITFTTCNDQAEVDANTLRLESELKLREWQAELNTLNSFSAQTVLDAAIGNSTARLTIFVQLLQRVSDLLTMSCTINDSAYDTYRTNVATARTNVITVLNSVNSDRDTISSQKLVVQRVSRELDLLKAGSTVQDIAAQEATVRQAEANITSGEAAIRQAEASVANIYAQISKGVIRSPLNGTVTRREVKAGEIVTANVSVISVISDGQMEIKADVPEVDIAKVQLGNSASVTLDAYGNDAEFSAKVVKIDPAETVISGVIYYKVTLVFENIDERLKSGMTANINLITAKKENVLAVPQRAVLNEGGKPYVRVVDAKDSKKFEKREVVTGLSGVEGTVEIVSGLKEGEIIITFLKN